MRAFLTNAAVLTVAAVALAVTPVTVSFPIAVAEALVLVGGLGVALVLNLALLARAFESAPARTPSGASSATHEPHGTRGGNGGAPMRVGARATGATTLTVSARARAPRLLVCWAAPQHLSNDEAEQWASKELRQALEAKRAGAAQLWRLRSASPRYGKPCDWLLEVDVAPGRETDALLRAPTWREWPDHLRLLGLGPAAMVADRGHVLTVEND